MLMRWACVVAFLMSPFLALQVTAQTATPEADNGDAPTTVEFTHQGFVYDFDTSEAVRVEVTNRSDNLNGSWVAMVVMVQLPGGDVVALTPCDDLATPCAPITTAAIGSLDDAENGTRLVLKAD